MNTFATYEKSWKRYRKQNSMLMKRRLNSSATKLISLVTKFLRPALKQMIKRLTKSWTGQFLNPQEMFNFTVQAFLGLVRYLNAFLPNLAVQSNVLNRLTTKECDKNFPTWMQEHQDAFDKIKSIVVSRECLTVIDHNKLDSNKIFLTTDASDRATGTVLFFGPTWETVIGRSYLWCM